MPRGTEVSVVLDLMIHDIEVLLHLVDSKVVDFHAVGIPVLSASEDIANVRLQFENGCVVNLTASRISQKSMRKMRLFQNEDYITIDFQSGVLEEYRIMETLPEPGKDEKVFPLDGDKYVLYRKPEIPRHDALKEELLHFVESIMHGQQPETDGQSATQALSLALEIQKLIDR